jgi:hypothetical protein
LLLLDLEPALVRLAVQARLRATPEHSSNKVAPREPKLSRGGKRVLEFAADEARRLEARHIGTEHLLLGVARARWDAMPWYFFVLWPLHQWKLIPEATLREVWRNVSPEQTAVADVLAEFRLDLPTLRLATAGEASLQTRWTEEVQRVVDRAREEARTTGASRVATEHLWLGLLAEEGSAARQMLDATGSDAATMAKHLRQSLLSDNETAGTKARYTPEARRAFAAAGRIAQNARCRYVGSDHLLLALLGIVSEPESALQRAHKLVKGEAASRADAILARALSEQGLTLNDVRQKLAPKVRSKSTVLNEKELQKSIVDQVLHIVAQELRLPRAGVKLETRLFKESSSHLDTLDILKRCSREFAISFVPEDISKIQTAGELSVAVLLKSAEREQHKPTPPLANSMLNAMAFLIWPFLGTAFYLTPSFSADALNVSPLYSTPLLVATLVCGITLLVVPATDTRFSLWRSFSQYFLAGIGLFLLVWLCLWLL